MKRYEELKTRIESFIDDESKDNFNDLILETHSFQRSTCQLIHNYADNYCSNPETWHEVAPIPTEALKNTNLITFPEKRISKTFLTSGLCSIFHARACSRPPLPIISAFIFNV